MNDQNNNQNIEDPFNNDIEVDDLLETKVDDISSENNEQKIENDDLNYYDYNNDNSPPESIFDTAINFLKNNVFYSIVGFVVFLLLLWVVFFNSNKKVSSSQQEQMFKEQQATEIKTNDIVNIPSSNDIKNLMDNLLQDKKKLDQEKEEFKNKSEVILSKIETETDILKNKEIELSNKEQELINKEKELDDKYSILKNTTTNDNKNNDTLTNNSTDENKVKKDENTICIDKKEYDKFLDYKNRIQTIPNKKISNKRKSIYSKYRAYNDGSRYRKIKKTIKKPLTTNELSINTIYYDNVYISDGQKTYSLREGDSIGNFKIIKIDPSKREVITNKGVIK